MNQLRKSLTLAAGLSLAVMGLGTGAVAGQNGSPEPVLIADYCANVTTQTTPLAVREGPGVVYPVIGSIPKGAKVRVARRNSAPINTEAWHWLYITRAELPNGEQQLAGWVSSKFIGAGFNCQGFGGAS
ncbi:SH3 domain-containing protein [Microcoleus sp. FACHB-68]|uniref:SH3 domain-containing protein n=1 Tax=Microcoleus sp. FACHB-68 TaxID=2692826 RepID=UPI00168481AD|nr:SH3 domain-containing protein [Microcoleus sp. FACHB-68]MBD1936021.1 SH3 domain-containing protein [Microcoleus sp. FACHB-68]